MAKFEADLLRTVFEMAPIFISDMAISAQLSSEKTEMEMSEPSSLFVNLS